MKQELKFSKHCPRCNGQEIFQQTFWTWDIEAQDWKANDDDLIQCPNCGWSGYEVKTKIIEDEEE